MVPRKPGLLLLVWSAVFTCALGAGSCDDRGTVYAPSEQGLPKTPNQLVLALRNAYFRVDASAIDALLHPDFTFRYDPTDADSLGLADRWVRAREMEFTTNMFSGRPGLRVDGTRQPPLDLINAFAGQLTPADGSVWTTVRSGPYAGTLTRMFYANWFSQYEELDTDFVQGFNQFYVIEESLPGRYGEPIAVYRLLHWHDLGLTPGSVGKHQTISWARLKAKFRTIPDPVRSDPPPP